MIVNSGADLIPHFWKSCPFAPNFLGNTQISSNFPPKSMVVVLEGEKPCCNTIFLRMKYSFQKAYFDESTFPPNFQQAQCS